MKKCVGLKSAFCVGAVSLLIGCADRATEPGNDVQSRRQQSSENSASNGTFHTSGNVKSSLLTLNADGTRTRRFSEFDVDQSLSKAGGSNVNSNRKRYTTESQVVEHEPVSRMSVGTPVAAKNINGRSFLGFALETRRLSSKNVDGHTVEMHEVQGKSKQPAAYIIVIDGVMRQQYELTYQSNSKKLNSVRGLVFDERGKLSAEQVTDVSNLVVGQRLSGIAQADGRQYFGRLLRGMANLVLPDQLHAQSPVTDPCVGSRQNFELTIDLMLGNGVLLSAALAACGLGFAPVCAYAVDLTIALAALATTALFWNNELNTCRAEFPSCPGPTWGSGGTCPPDEQWEMNGGGSSGGSSGSGGSGSTLSSTYGSSWTPSGWSNGSTGGTYCAWREYWDPNTFTTHAEFSCVNI